MNAVEKFWEEIAELIKSEYGKGHPAEWDKNKIKLFLEDFYSKLVAICQNDSRKAELCKLTKNKAGTTPQPTTSYDSFRRIFITGDSSGNRTTREMFAIYLGYDSAHDLMMKRGLVEKARIPIPESPKAPSNKFQPRRWIFIVAALIIIILLLLNKCACSHSRDSRYMMVKNERGIACINLSTNRLYQIIDFSPIVIGIDFDPATRMLFWANSHDNYQCLSSAKVNASFTGIEEITLNTRLTKRMNYPAGIAIDAQKKVIYCADYKDSVILKFDYNGNEMNMPLISKLPGRPSSIVLNSKQQILYWTDITNHKIGRILLNKERIEPNFISSPGRFPDGLSLDTIHNKIYWAANRDSKIGWANLSSPKPHWIKLDQKPSAIEVDAKNGILYCTFWSTKLIGKIHLPAKQNTYKISAKNTFSAGAPSPGVVKLIDLKDKR